jgi:hypothetical protein
MGKAVSGYHKTSKEQSTKPVISWDYMYLRSRTEEETNEDIDESKMDENSLGMPILISKDRKGKTISAQVMPEKGAIPYAVLKMSQDIKNLGYREVIIKTDQEPSIKNLKEKVMNELGFESQIESILEESPVGESQSNGEIEEVARTVGGQVRTMKQALEDRYNTIITAEHQSMPWSVRYAAQTINRCRILEDGRTPYQNMKGRKFKRKIAEIGECVYYLKAKSKGKFKLDSRWGEGIFYGVRDESNEVIIGTEEGTIKVYSFRRKASDEDRWNKEMFNKAKGVPWQPDPNSKTHEIKTRVVIPRESEEITKAQKGTETVIRVNRPQITKALIRQLGMTNGCPGCSAVNSGNQRGVNHNKQCRTRFEQWMYDNEDPRAIRYAKRVEEDMNERNEDIKREAVGNKKGMIEVEHNITQEELEFKEQEPQTKRRKAEHRVEA